VGKEVLLVGSGAIATRACIGAESTIMNPQIEADAVVTARSLIGDRGQFLPPPAPAVEANGTQDPPPSAAAGIAQNGQSPAASPPPAETNGAAADRNGAGAQSSDEAEASTLAAAKMVYGREQVMQLMKTLFPHRDMLNGDQNQSDNSS
jgi:carbon dioxide concentrating mechanism protein CcmN